MATKLHDSLVKQRQQVKRGFDRLTEEYKTWCANNGLPWHDALELAMSDLPNEPQHAYLMEFIDRWEMLERLDNRLGATLKQMGEANV